MSIGVGRSRICFSAVSSCTSCFCFFVERLWIMDILVRGDRLSASQSINRPFNTTSSMTSIDRSIHSTDDVPTSEICPAGKSPRTPSLSRSSSERASPCDHHVGRRDDETGCVKTWGGVVDSLIPNANQSLNVPCSRSGCAARRSRGPRLSPPACFPSSPSCPGYWYRT